MIDSQQAHQGIQEELEQNPMSKGWADQKAHVICGRVGRREGGWQRGAEG